MTGNSWLYIGYSLVYIYIFLVCIYISLLFRAGWRENKTEEATDVTPTEEKVTEASAAHFHGVRNSGIAR